MTKGSKIMNRYFERDIDKLEALKNGFFVTLASTVVCALLTVGFTTCYAIGKTNEYPATASEKRELVEIAENDQSYQEACKNFQIGFQSELEAGKITEREYKKQMDYLENPEFINKVVNSAKTAAINEKVHKRQDNFSKYGSRIVLSGALTAGSAIACGAIKRSRKNLKKRWYSEEEGRGL